MTQLHNRITNSLGYRDFLAADRTRLANERTMLAYVRTGLNALIVGVSFVKLFDSIFFQVSGLILISTGFIICVIGLWKYIKMDRLIESVRKVTIVTDDDE